MLLIVGTVRLPPGNLAAALPKMERMILSSRVEEGCQEYVYSEDILVPGLIHVKERWQSRYELERHFQSEHIAVWRACWPALGITDRDLRVYQVDDGAEV